MNTGSSSPATRRWDCVVLGEVMLRLDPGDMRVRTARSFRVWEGGGEYNVGRALAKVFGQRVTAVTALVANDIGRLVEDLMCAGGVDLSHVVWMPYDGIGHTRVGLNFTERGYGVRGAMGISDRANSATSKLTPGDVDWSAVFEQEGARWFHTGGIFAGLSGTTADVAAEAMSAARASGATVSYDVNLRPSLWQAGGDPVPANCRLVSLADAVFGSVEDYRTGLGMDIEHLPVDVWMREPDRFARLAAEVRQLSPTIGLVGMTLRDARSAGRNAWGGLLADEHGVHVGRFHPELEVYDRVGSGDSFVSGVVWSLLDGDSPAEAVEIGVAHGALAMTTPGDSSMATLDEVRRTVDARDARVRR